MSAKTTGAEPNGEARHRQHHDGSSGRAFTVEQKAAVIRIKRCSPTAYYEILGLEEVRKTCTETDIKKAYRKLSLLTHPDKNGYEGADEAFKLVSKAFQVLSDPDRKAKYDRFGGDPDSRFGGGASAGASPFSNFARGGGAQRAGPMFEEEISAEDLFKQFFGGGMGGPFGGGIFDTGPAFVFNMGGGPGIRIHQFGGGRPRRRPGTAQPPGSEEQPSFFSALSSLLPLLLLFILPLLSSLFSGSTSSTPSFIFDGPKAPYTQSRTSHPLKVPYYVKPVDVEDYGARNSRKWQSLDQVAEGRYIQIVTAQCEREYQAKQALMQEAQGWFSTDMEKMQKARTMEMPNCKRARELGIRV
ncbi:DUF1977-domain-containing protein [Westerdykella ornata]|uniref:DUF1977-domain-containing protein n=1 Tax=Westerdykella ornata TaxID=318751 RepID=A0A6A6JWZ6_WESOR|nr:DUF1977-domain-containing protein [Westerdykella ornata]KAF2280593.1 DUF1977-domain-containing protein [Westerdykella ornata]